MTLALWVSDSFMEHYFMCKIMNGKVSAVHVQSSKMEDNWSSFERCSGETILVESRLFGV